MKFKHWFDNTEYTEMSDISNMPTDDVHFELMDEDGDDFDEEATEQQCEKDLRHDDYGHRDEIYDDPEDDPGFKSHTPSQWEIYNPPPDSEDYDDGESDSEYKQDQINWENKKYDYEKEYEKKVAEWEKGMSNKRTHAEDRESESRFEAIHDCVSKKRKEWEEEQKANGNFRSKFTHGTDEFSVNMEKSDIRYANQFIPGSFSIEFEGPNGFNTTGTAGGAATAIYSKMLLAIKKLMTTQVVNGITFTPAEPGMALIYRRFYERFLKKDFTQTGPTEIVRRTMIEKINEKITAQQRQMADEKSAEASQRTSDYLQNIKSGRADERKAKLLAATVMNKIVRMQNGNNIFVVKFSFEEGKPMMQGITDEGGIYHAIKAIPGTLTATPSDGDSSKKMLEAIAKNKKWMKFIGQDTLRPLFAQYGVNPTATPPETTNNRLF